MQPVREAIVPKSRQETISVLLIIGMLLGRVSLDDLQLLGRSNVHGGRLARFGEFHLAAEITR